MNSALFVVGIFVAACVTIHAAPLDKEAGKPFLDEANKLKIQVKEILEQIEKVRGELPDVERQVSQALSKNALVLQGEEAIKEAESGGRNVDNCKATFDNSMHALIERVNNDVQNNTSADLHKAEHSLKNIQKELEEMTQHLESGDGKFSAIETIEKQDSYFVNVDGWKARLPLLVESALSYLNNDEATEMINKNVLIPTIECLLVFEVEPKITEMVNSGA